ncbi:MAG: hypothetical protein CVU71_06340 [Deltaproteobacteria bacterium HGW-Deltaproteobacteria-6]|jgi:hypothetical protein|nr:MAG: hypothetical protein CVU71_06340 [Deltaproteobacteria bacterium HGW-Deltaproteobacteria-6]
MQVFQRDYGSIPAETALQRNGLYEEVLRRFIDGIMEFGYHRRYAGVIILRCDDRWIDGRNFCAHEHIGTDRTDGLMTLLTGSIGLRLAFSGIANIRVRGFHVRDSCFTAKRGITCTIGVYHTVEHRCAKVKEKNGIGQVIFE